MDQLASAALPWVNHFLAPVPVLTALLTWYGGKIDKSLGWASITSPRFAEKGQRIALSPDRTPNRSLQCSFGQESPGLQRGLGLPSSMYPWA